jgi:PPOX class probable F420-dependent enzyme
MSATTMTRAEREAFLAAVHVGVVCVAEAGRGPLAVPVWYAYDPGGDVRFSTGAGSRKATALRAAGRATLCAQAEAPPYAYVTVEGPVTLESPDFERDIREVAVRYLGEQGAAAYLAGQSPGEENVLVRLRPERWLSVDYGKLFRR